MLLDYELVTFHVYLQNLNGLGSRPGSPIFKPSIPKSNTVRTPRTVIEGVPCNAQTRFLFLLDRQMPPSTCSGSPMEL